MGVFRYPREFEVDREQELAIIRRAYAKQILAWATPKQIRCSPQKKCRLMRDTEEERQPVPVAGQSAQGLSQAAPVRPFREEPSSNPEPLWLPQR